MEFSLNSSNEVKQKKCSKFIMKLFQILDVLEVYYQKQQNEEIKWNEDGDSFLVIDSIQLIQTVLSTSFKQSSFLSFSRQLNQYGFKKQRVGKKKYVYKHQYFKKNREKELVKIVSSHKIKANKKIHEYPIENGELCNFNEHNSLRLTIKNLQNQQKQICASFSEQIQLQMQIKQKIINIKNRIVECDQCIDNYCFIAQLMLMKALSVIPNDNEHQQEIIFVKQILQEFSNMYTEYNEQPFSQRSSNFSIRSFTPLQQSQQFQEEPQKQKLINQNNAQIQVYNYILWLWSWYQEALQIYGSARQM